MRIYSKRGFRATWRVFRYMYSDIRDERIERKRYQELKLYVISAMLSCHVMIFYAVINEASM